MWALLALLAACGGDDGSLEWRVTFESGGLRASTESVRAVVTAGPCEAATGTRYDELLASGDTAPSVPGLESGSFCFVATAFDARCDRVGVGCRQVELPAVDGTIVETMIGTTAAACPTATPPVCDRDAGPPDAGTADGGPPFEPVVIARDVIPDAIASTVVDVPVGEPTVALVTAAATGQLTAAAGAGFVLSRIVADGAGVAGTVTTRDGLMNESLYSASAAVLARPTSPAQFGLGDEAMGYTAMPTHSLGYALLAERLVDHGAERADTSNTASATVVLGESSLLVFHGWYRAAGSASNRYIGVSLGIDGAPCVANEIGSEIWSSRNFEASALCIADVGPGSYSLEVAGQRPTGDTDEVAALGWVAIPSRLAGTSTSAMLPATTASGALELSRPVTVEGPAALVVVGTVNARDGGGWHDVTMSVDGVECARNRNFRLPTNDTVASAACVLPVEAGDVMVAVGTYTEGGGTPPTRSLALRYALLPAVP